MSLCCCHYKTSVYDQFYWHTSHPNTRIQTQHTCTLPTNNQNTCRIYLIDDSGDLYCCLLVWSLERFMWCIYPNHFQVLHRYWIINYFIIQGLYLLIGRKSYCKISKPRDSGLNFFKHSEIWPHLHSTAAEMPVKFLSDAVIITPNLAASRRREIWR